jgi:hypothetical protein
MRSMLCRTGIRRFSTFIRISWKRSIEKWRQKGEKTLMIETPFKNKFGN